MSESVDNEGGAAGRMSPGQSRFDLEFADLKSFSFRKRLCAGCWFAFRNENGRACFPTKPIKILDVIGMRVRQQNQFHAQFFPLDPLQHFTAISAGIERDGIARFRIPDEIRVYRHVAISRVELRHAVQFNGAPVSIARAPSRSKRPERDQGSARRAASASSSKLPSRNARIFSAGTPDFSRELAVGNPRPRCALPMMSVKLSSSGIML